VAGDRHPGWTGPAEDRRTYYVEDRTQFLAGGLGVVYRATTQTEIAGLPMGTEVAVKQFTGEVTEERFGKLQERAPALEQVDHPNLARLVEVFKGPPFVEGPVDEAEATERFCVHVWVEGAPLSECCLDVEPLEILRWGEEAAAALDHLHTHPAGPFAHRDVHPRNIVISSDGHAVLIDYDTILVDGSGEVRTTIPLPGTRFAPRERGPGLAGAQRDDRWSLACTVLYALARNPTGSLRLADACAEAESRLKGAVADPTGIVLELRRVLDGEDPGSANDLFLRLQRIAGRRRRRAFARREQRVSSWEEPPMRRSGLLGTPKRRVAVALVVLLLAGSGVAGAVIANERPTSSPPRRALGVPLAKRTTSTTTTSTSTTTTTTTTASPVGPSSSGPQISARWMTSGPDGAIWFTDTNNAIGRITNSGQINLFYNSGIDLPQDIVTGPDGALWFTSDQNNEIGRITTAGVVTMFADPSISSPYGITVGPDGALWFTNFSGDSIGRITTTGAVSSYPIPGANNSPAGIVTGPDGALWFTNANSDSIGRITVDGTVTNVYPTGTDALDIVVGPDQNLWFTNYWQAGSIGFITTSGSVQILQSEYVDSPAEMVLGPDGALWFASRFTNSVVRVTTAGLFSRFTDPGMSNPNGIAVGSDGAIWFCNEDGAIGRLGTDGKVMYYGN